MTKAQDRCSGGRMNLGAYFMQGRRVWEPCDRPPAFRVFVNPPRGEDDGTSLLCDHCNRNDYIGFSRSALNTRKGE